MPKLWVSPEESFKELRLTLEAIKSPWKNTLFIYLVHDSLSRNGMKVAFLGDD